MNLSSRRRARPEDLSADAAHEAIKFQVRKQLDTSLLGTIGDGREFEASVPVKSYASSVAGTQTLNDYEERRKAEEKLDELRHAGLTEQELGLYIEHGLGSGNLPAAKRTRQIGTSEALEARLTAIKEKLSDQPQQPSLSWQLDVSSEQQDSSGTDAPYSMRWKPPEDLVPSPPRPIFQKSAAKSGEHSSMVQDVVDDFVPPRTSGQGLGASSLLPPWEEVKREQPAGIVLALPKQRKSVCVTRSEIEASRLPVDEIRKLPRFESYSAGSPSETLYIKNLASATTRGDLQSVFSTVCEGLLSEGPLDVRLMKKGRLRGQAFVTFPSLESSRLALETVNGFLLHTKPLIIQYGRATCSDAKADSPEDAKM